MSSWVTGLQAMRHLVMAQSIAQSLPAPSSQQLDERSEVMEKAQLGLSGSDDV